MKTSKILRLFAATLVLSLLALSAFAQRERAPFNDGWLFQRDDPKGAEGVLSYAKIKDWYLPSSNALSSKQYTRPAGNLGENVAYTTAAFDDRSWRKLDLPHDWAIEGDFQQALPGDIGKRPYAGIGWYRKHFQVSKTDVGRRFYIDFDGAMSYPAVWLNGQFVGGWGYGYSSFQLDLTPYIKAGENVMSVRLDNPAESSRWYPGAGIYRNVWLSKTAQTHVSHWGTSVTTPEVSSTAATVEITTVAEDHTAKTPLSIGTVLYAIDANDNRISPPIKPTKDMAATLGEGPVVKIFLNEKFTVANPKLWSGDSPNRYVAVTTVSVNGKVVDSYETKFGIRDVKFTKDGMFVNGKREYLKGTCNHHDLGALGTAVNYRAVERQLELLKEMGDNALRTSHNPPTPELLELADKMGFYVMDEAFDEWVKPKRDGGYNLLFPDWHEQDLRALILRDRNHPSVVLWSTGNEIWEQDPKFHDVSVMLTKIVHETDPTRPATAGANHTPAGYNGFQKTVDIFGYNYKPMEYAKFRAANPEQPLFASETASTVSSRGEYFFPVVNDKLKGKYDFQLSSYDLYAPPWATPPDTEFEGQDKNPHVFGEFVWTGFDYIGEPTPYDDDKRGPYLFTDPEMQKKADAEWAANKTFTTPSRSSYFGILDLAGFKKDRFYIYQARWRPELPMAHILPHWNWPERVGQVTPVHVYTSGDEAELFLNGKSLGRKKRAEFQYRFRWDDVVYEPGELKVVTYKGGKLWATEIVRTTGAAAGLGLASDRGTIKADGSDLAFITVRVTDAKGATVPRSKNWLKFEVTNGEIVATDNGDATDHLSFQSKTRKAYNGLALVIVRTKKAGKVTVKASGDGLKTGTVTFVAR